jgi:translocation and assembly module TamB
MVAINIDLFPVSVDVVTAVARNVDIKLIEADSAEPTSPDMGEILRNLTLPIPVRISDFRAYSILLATPEITEEFDSLALAAIWFETVTISQLDIERPDFSAGASAAIDLQNDNTLNAEISAQLNPVLTGMIDVLAVQANVSGDPYGVELRSTVGSFATIKGSISWREGLKIVAEILLDGLDPTEVADMWPAGHPIDGRIQAAVDESSVRISDSTLRVAGTDMQLFIDAILYLENDKVDGQLRWENLRWPLPAQEIRVRSKTGDIRLAGDLEDWSVDGRVAVGTEEMPNGIFVLDVAGSRESVAGRIVEGRVFGGDAVGEVAYSWVGDQPWSANLDILNINLGSIVADVPGRVSGRVDGRGSIEPFALHATLNNIAGNIRGAELRASGAVDVEDGAIEAQGLRIEHGDSWLILDGSPMAENGLAFEASVADVKAYNDDVSGALHANGLAWAKGAEAAIELSLSSPDFAFRDFKFANLSVLAEGTHEQQSLRLSVVHLDTPFELGVTGAFDDWRQPLDSLWRGNIDVFRLDLGDQHAMTLNKAAPLELSTTHARLSEFCVGDHTGSSLCADGTWNHNNDYSLALQMIDMPVSVVEHLSDTDLLFDQLVSGTLDWQHSNVRGASGLGRLSISPGIVRSGDDERNFLATGNGIVDFEIEDGSLLSGVIEMPFPGTGTLSGRFAMQDVAAGASSEVTGSADIDVTDLRRLSRLSPLIDSASGSLRAGIELSGTIATPVLGGDLSVKNGALRYMPLGLELDDIDLEGRMNDDFRFDLSGTFRAGEGRAEIISSGGYDDIDQPGLLVHLKGDNLTLVNVPDVKVTVNSDIELGLNRDTLSINGDLLVPMARIRPTNLATAKVSESEDVVIVAGELPDLPEEVQGGDGLQFTGELDVVLGNSVIINLDRGRAAVTGGVKFNWQGDVIPIANGRYDIAGSVQAFGQVLDITAGAVRFPNVPADSPFIRVRAEREIYGNTQVKTAGVFVDGPVNRLIVSPYTMPPTTEERAMALLVTGSDFDYEQGVGAIDFGTYIAPRLFISYGVGVFERENVISARYDITKGFGVKASSGSKESGVDLNYRFEN